MKKAKNALLLALCAVLLVGATIAGTVAYLTSQTEVVKNTFTAGNVTIKLEEYKVDAQTGKKGTEVVTKLENLELVPGREIEKNPFITVDSASESCYLFVKIMNGLGDSVIINGMEGWVPLDDGYYRYNKIANASDVVNVFTSVSCKSNVEFADIEDKSIVITAYAVQSEGVNETVAYDTVKTLD